MTTCFKGHTGINRANTRTDRNNNHQNPAGEYLQHRRRCGRCVQLQHRCTAIFIIKRVSHPPDVALSRFKNAVWHLL